MATLEQVEQGIKALGNQDLNDPDVKAQLKVLAAERQRLLSGQQQMPITQPTVMPGMADEAQKAAGFKTVDPVSQFGIESRSQEFFGPGMRPLPGPKTAGPVPAMPLQPPDAPAYGGLPPGETVPGNVPVAPHLTQQQQRLAEFARQARQGFGSEKTLIGPAPQNPAADESQAGNAIWQLKNKGGTYDPNYNMTPAERAGDLYKSVDAGIGRGAAMTGGLPSLIQQSIPWLDQQITGRVMRLGGYSEDDIKKRDEAVRANVAGGTKLPTYEDMVAGMQRIKPETDLGYKSATKLGQYGGSVAEMVGSGVGGRGVAGFAVNTLAPGIGSQFAYDVTGGAPGSKLAGALMAPLGAHGVGRFFESLTPTARAIRNAPTMEALTHETDALYTTLRRQGIQYDPRAFQATVMDAARELHAKGFRPVKGMEQPFDWLRQLALTGRRGRSPDFGDINALRTQIGTEARQAYSKPETHSLGRALDIIQDHLDDFEGSAPFISTSGISHAELNQTRTRARELALRRIKQRALDAIDVRANTVRAGRDAGIRNQIGNLLRSERGRQLFPPGGAEHQMLLDIEHGNKALMTFGKTFGYDLGRRGGNNTFLPAIAALGLGGSTALGGAAPYVAIGAGLAGTAAKTISPYLTEAALRRAGRTVRSGAIHGRRAGAPRSGWGVPLAAAGVGAPIGVYGLAGGLDQ